MIATDTPPSSVVVNTQGLESGGSWFETCSGVWYPRRRPCGVAINTLVDLINWLGKPQVFFLTDIPRTAASTTTTRLSGFEFECTWKEDSAAFFLVVFTSWTESGFCQVENRELFALNQSLLKV